MLTIFGEHNHPFEFQKRWKTLFPHARQVVVSDGHHFPMSDDPALAAVTIRSWYRDLVAAWGNLERLVAVLADEVVLYSDGGGKANAALRPLHGALNVARFVLGAVAKAVPNDVRVHIEAVNGQPSVVYRVPGGAPGCVVSVVISGERIGEILIVTNPDKLVHIVRSS